MKKNLLYLGAVVLLSGMSTVTQAAEMTLTKWTFGSGPSGNGNAVQASGYSGLAGGFSGTLSGAGAPFDGSIETYCVELGQYFSFDTSYNNYNVVAARTYFGDAKADTLGKLLSYANPFVSSAGDGTRDNYSTSLQLAIWNTVYDTDYTLAGVSADHFNDNSAFAAEANSFLSGANAQNQTNDLDLWVLQSLTGDPTGNIGRQDQLIWRKRSDVPEPASLALVLAALGGLGVVSRRRKTSSA